MRILVDLEFDENYLGPKWMNPDNFDLLLYGEHSTKRNLLKVVSFKEVASQQCDCCEVSVYPFCTKCGKLRTTN